MTEPAGNAGGSAAGGGFDFQFAVTAVALVDCAVGQRLDWLGDSHSDVPVNVHTETHGAGDDLGIVLAAGGRIEAQVKKGLRRGPDLSTALDKLARGVASDEQLWGVLVVCPNSSGTIRNELARDLRRLADGRTHKLGEVAVEFVQRLTEMRLDAAKVAQRLFVRTLHCLDADGANVKAAKSALARLSDYPDAAWALLYEKAGKLVTREGGASADAVARCLQAGGLALRSDDIPASVLLEHQAWLTQKLNFLRVAGHPQPLQLQQAFIELDASVGSPVLTRPEDFAAAVRQYHQTAERFDSRSETVNAASVSRFEKRCVVVGGPGMGKSTLLKKLALDHLADGALILHFSALAVAERMKNGATFVEAALALSADGFPHPLTAEHVRGAPRCVVLCDGLDEAKRRQSQVAEGLISMALGFPDATFVVTTRPVGYEPSLLADWRHYQLLPIESSSVTPRVLEHAMLLAPNDTSLSAFAKAQLSQNENARIAARSPLILSLVAGLLAARESLAASRTKLYRMLFHRLSRSYVSRREASPLDELKLTTFLQWCGLEVMQRYAVTKNVLLHHCTTLWAEELQRPALSVSEVVEQCWEHWLGAGVLETIHFGDDDVVTFIHKTFAEFAAAERLQSLPPNQAGQLVAAHLFDTSWREVWVFAASMGMLDTLVEMALDRGTPGAIVLALELATNSDAELDVAVRRRLCALSAEIVRGNIPREAVDVAESFVDFAKRYPADAAVVALPLLESKQPWTRLAGLALVACACPDSESLPAPDELLVELASLRGQVVERAQSIHAGLDIHAFPGRQLDFLHLHCTRKALASGKDAVEQLVKRMVDRELVGTGGGTFEVMALLQPEYPELARALGQRAWGDWSLDLDEERDDYADFFALLRPHLPEPGQPSPPRAAWTLSAVLSVSGFSARLASDTWPASIPPDDPAVVEAIRGILAASGLNRKKLSQDIADIEWAAQERNEPLWRVAHAHTEYVDVPTNWKAALLDVGLLERALHIPVLWMSLAAGEMLAARCGNEEELAALVARGLEKAHGVPFQVVAELARILPAERRQSLVLERLQSPVVPGLYHAIAALDPAEKPPGLELLEVSRRILLGDGPKTAEKWADWLVRSQAEPDTWYALVDEAFAHWKDLEPSDKGVVADSPRKPLLLLMLGSTHFDSARLMNLVFDTRHDVSQVALSALLSALESGQLIDGFIEAVRDGRAKPGWLAQALKRRIPLSPEQAKAVRALLHSNVRRIRKAAMGILELDARPSGEDPDLSLLLQDEDGEIQELARRIASSLPAP